MSEHGKWFEIVKLYIGYEPVFILLAWARHIEKWLIQTLKKATKSFNFDNINICF